MTTSRIAKVAVLCCSLLLAGGYLYYAGSDARMTSSKRAHITTGEGGAPLEAEVFTLPAGTSEKDPNPPPAEPRMLAASSKFARVTVPPTTQPRTIIPSGYKSAPVTILPDPPARPMLGGSKSDTVDVLPDERAMMAGSKSGMVVLPRSAKPTTEPGSVLYADGHPEFGGVIVYADATTQPSAQHARKPERRMMSGSKYYSGGVVNPETVKGLLAVDANPATQPSTQPATQPATAPSTRRVFMGGSKSIQVDRPPQQQR